ncbi:MAG: PTS sugar transporter subunit IIA [Candidatus Izemoplasmataceae bacterium]
MKVNELIKEELVLMHLNASTKVEVIKELAMALKDEDRINDLDEFVKAVMDRESLSSTGVGYGIAIPHAKTKAVKVPSLVFGRHEKGIDYDSLDGEPSDLFFLIAAPLGGENLHLQTLAKLSRKLMDETFRDSLRSASSIESILKTIQKIDKEEK